MKNVCFNFSEEIDQIFNTFAALKKDTLFVTLADHPPGTRSIHAYHDDSFPMPGMGPVPRLVHAHILAQINSKRADRTSAHAVFTLRPRDNRHVKHRLHVIIFNPETGLTRIMPEKFRAALQMFSFYHELGHRLVPGGRGKGDRNDPLPDCMADAYAALRCLQTLGAGAREVVGQVCNFRAWEFAHTGEAEHLSVPVLDRILADAKHWDFSRLTPHETVAMARHYAEEYAPRGESLERARESFAPLAGFVDRLAENDGTPLSPLLDTTLETESRLCFSIGTHIFAPLLKDDGMHVGGARFVLPDPLREQVRDIIEQRAGEMKTPMPCLHPPQRYIY